MNFLGRRLAIAAVAFFAAVNLDFILPRLVPGNAAQVYAAGGHLPTVQVKLITERLGLDQSITTQYFLFLKGLFANWPPYFGVSYEFYPQSVSSLIAQRLPATVLLLVASFFLSLTISYVLAQVSVVRRGGVVEFSSLYASIVLYAIPAFWISMILVWTFGVTLHWLPVSGNTAFVPGAGLNYVYSVFTHSILPVIALTSIVFGQGYMLLRGASQEILKSDYVEAAKLRGLRKRVIANRYILRNSLLPIVSLTGYSIASIISAEILIESVFAYGGVGDLIIDGVINRDYPVLQGSFFYVTVLVIVFTVFADIALRQLDPRLR